MIDYERDEVAMCLWEAVLEAKGEVPGVELAFEDNGTAEVRMALCGEPVEACEAAWIEATKRGYDDSFDWEFCPKFVAYGLLWDAEEAGLPTLADDLSPLWASLGLPIK